MQSKVFSTFIPLSAFPDCKVVSSEGSESQIIPMIWAHWKQNSQNYHLRLREVWTRRWSFEDYRFSIWKYDCIAVLSTEDTPQSPTLSHHALQACTILLNPKNSSSPFQPTQNPPIQLAPVPLLSQVHLQPKFQFRQTQIHGLSEYIPHTFLQNRLQSSTGKIVQKVSNGLGG